MEYTCEDTNIALQRRLHDDMDTCAFTHFGLLETTGVVQPPRVPAPVAPVPRETPRPACVAQDTQKVMWVVALVALVVAAVAYGQMRK